MRKLALALLIAASPAVAETAGDSIYQVRFQGVTFTCGTVENSGGLQRLLHADHKLNLPVYEPKPSDARADSWAIVYRIVCERTLQQQRAAGVQQASSETKSRRF
jgi:hypothetical protein